MIKYTNRILFVLVFLMAGTLLCMFRHISIIKAERDKYESNNHALLSDVNRFQVDSATMALEANVLKLSLDEYKKYRAQDLEQIKQLGVKLKNLEAVGKHIIEVNANYTSAIKDTIIIKDTVPTKLQSIQVNTPYLYVDGIISDNNITGSIKLPVTLRQALSVEYKHRFLWWQWKVKGIRQIISSDNPHVEIKYTEMIKIE